MTKHSTPDPKLSIAIPLPDRSVAGIEAAVERASQILTDRKAVDPEIMDSIGPRLGEWALAALAIQPARTTTEALTKAVMARWTIDRLFRFPDAEGNPETRLLATALYDDVIRVLQAEAGVTVEDLSLNGHWDEWTSVLGKVAATLVEAEAGDNEAGAALRYRDRSWPALNALLNRCGKGDDDMAVDTALHWALRAVALQPAVTAEDALIRAVGGYGEFVSAYECGRWAADAMRIEAEQLVLVLLDETIRYLQTATGTTVEALGLGSFWSEEASLMGRIDKAAGGAGAPD